MFTPADVNIERVLKEIEALSKFGELPSGGITRYTFSEAHQQAANQVADWMNAAGLEVHFDRWGNLFGRTPGFDGAKCVLSGSHVDSVPNGGNYDGPLGVLSSLEAVRLILESGGSLKKPLEVVSFIEEEGAGFSGLLGSRLAAGKLTQEQINTLQDRQGNRFVDVLAGVSFPYRVDQNDTLTHRLDAYIELHIEQGRRLENAGIPIGVVTAIAGPNFMRVRLIGRSDHAGATAYEDRQDTLLAASEIVIGIRETGVSKFLGKGHMTVGRIQVKPNVVNVVAGETEISIDFRAADDQTAVEMRDAVTDLIETIARKHFVDYELPSVESVPAAITPDFIKDVVALGAQQARVKSQDIISWAAHDAMIMADLTSAGMIFVPCREGRSHTPEEFTNAEDIAARVATLANALVTLAG